MLRTSLETLARARTQPDMNTETPQYPYATHLNLHYSQLELVDVPALVAACKDRWYNQTLCQVNDAVVRLWQGFTVPKGVKHRTRAPQRAVILMVENAGIIPTGN